MWSIDIFIDCEWLNQQSWPIEAKAVIQAKFQTIPGLIVEEKFYGDKYAIKHVRLTGNFTSREQVEDFNAQKISMLRNSIELMSGLVSGKPVDFGLFGTTTFPVIFFEHTEVQNEKPAVITPNHYLVPFDYKAFLGAMSAQFPGFETYAFYLKNASDVRLPLDYRWLNLYRILEVRFNESGVGLAKNKEYKIFITSAGAEITLSEIEDIRGSIHAFSRGKKGKNLGIGHYGSYYSKKMIDSMPKLEKLAHMILEQVMQENGKEVKFFGRKNS